MDIIDITNPISPTVAGIYDIGNYYYKDIVVNGSYAYLSYSTLGTAGGVQILDITDPTTPTYKGEFDIAERAYGVSIQGFLAFIAYNNFGMAIADFSDPSNPVEIARYDMGYSEDVQRLFVRDNLIYMANGDDGLYILNYIIKNDPSMPLNLNLVDNSNRSVTLTWDAPLDDGNDEILYYEIYKGTSEINLLYINKVNGFEYIDTILIMGYEYYYALKAVNSVGGSNFTITKSIIAHSTPSAPRYFEVDANYTASVILQWDIPADLGGLDLGNFTLFKGLESDKLTELASVTNGTFIFFDYAIEQGETYYYAVRASNSLGEGELSARLSVTIPIEPDISDPTDTSDTDTDDTTPTDTDTTSTTPLDTTSTSDTGKPEDTPAIFAPIGFYSVLVSFFVTVVIIRRKNN